MLGPFEVERLAVDGTIVHISRLLHAQKIVLDAARPIAR